MYNSLRNLKSGPLFVFDLAMYGSLRSIRDRGQSSGRGSVR
jgi:hypothetical protein